MFAAVVTGAPLTNLPSMYNILYKQTGAVNQGILETGQGRWGANVNPWTAHDLIESQSPIHHVTKITTPFLILQGTADGAVDWNRGLEFYTAARPEARRPNHLHFRPGPARPGGLYAAQLILSFGRAAPAKLMMARKSSQTDPARSCAIQCMQARSSSGWRHPWPSDPGGPFCRPSPKFPSWP